jgi:hypothetical protein
VASKGGHDTAIPVVVTVAVEAGQADDGTLTGSLRFGGADVAAGQDALPYNNGAVFGSHDWNWRPESGDWRFFYLDVPQTPPTGSYFLVNTAWEDSPPTDLDTLVFGRSENHYQVAPIFGLPEDPFEAPYILNTVGGSPNANLGGGIWAFDTATGGPEDLVTAPAQEGLHAIAHHAVNWDGSDFYVPFETNVGSITVDPASVVVNTPTDDGGFDVTLEASLDLPGLAAEGFGLSQPIVTTENAQQDDPNDPSSASVKRQVTIDHASRLRVSTVLNQDIDLWLVFDDNGDGQFTADEIVASSATGSGNESLEVVLPEDGDYEVWVQGFAISGTPAFQLTIDPVQGGDLTVSGLPAGAVPAGTPVTIHVDFSKAMTAGQAYFGELLIGPPSAPTALSVPIRINRQ